MAALNPFNQQQRINSLQSEINRARSELLTIFYGSMVPLSSLSYYCQQLTPIQNSNITTALTNIQNNINLMNKVSPFNGTMHPYQLNSAQMTNTISTIKGMLGQTGTITAAAPIIVQQNNLAGGSNWALGNTPIPTAVSYTHLTLPTIYSV